MLSRTYFAFSRNLNIFSVFDRWLNPYFHSKNVEVNGKRLTVSWTKRAGQHLLKRDAPIFVEMQLFFSCVVKKRVLFHETCEYNTVLINDRLSVLFRPVEAASCDPVEFAKNFPEKRELKSSSAIKMRARALMIDFVDGEWVGEFAI